MESFSAWLEQQYIQWQADRKKHASIVKFSEWLGVDYAMVNQWMTGKRKPGHKYIDLLAQKLGLEVYDVLGLPRPDPLLFEVNAHWPQFSADEREAVRKVLKKVKERSAAQ